MMDFPAYFSNKYPLMIPSQNRLESLISNGDDEEEESKYPSSRRAIADPIEEVVSPRYLIVDDEPFNLFALDALLRV